MFGYPVRISYHMYDLESSQICCYHSKSNVDDLVL